MGNIFEVVVFDLVYACQLLDHELRIGKCLYLLSPKLDTSFDPELHGSVFGLVIGGDSQVFVPTFDLFSVLIGDVYSASGMSGIAA